MENTEKTKLSQNTMQGPLQGLFFNLQDCPLTVSSQLHKPGWRGREGVKEGLQNAIYPS